MQIAMLILNQMLKLFLMLLLGWLVVKTKLLKSSDSKVLSTIAVYLVTPCVIINAFQIDSTPDAAKGLLLAFAAAFAEEEKAKAAALEGEARLRAYLEAAGARADAIQLAATQAPIRQIRGEARGQLFLKLYFKADLEAVAGQMQALADAAPEGVRAELEVNPNSLV